MAQRGNNSELVGITITMRIRTLLVELQQQNEPDHSGTRIIVELIQATSSG